MRNRLRNTPVVAFGLKKRNSCSLRGASYSELSRLFAVLFASFVIGPLATLQTAEAACGIESCPAYRSVTRSESAFHASVTVEYANFKLYGTQGDYLMYTPRFEYLGVQHLVVGFQIPTTTLFWNDETKTGLSNPVLFGEWNWKSDPDILLGIGVQLELPFGDNESGIADSHIEILPYVRGYFDLGEYYFHLQLGLRQSLDEVISKGPNEEGHSHNYLIFVNPHEAQEILYRVNIGRKLFENKLRTAFYLDAVHELGERAETIPVTRLGLDTRLEIKADWDVRLRADRGVSSHRRTEWRTDLTLQYQW